MCVCMCVCWHSRRRQGGGSSQAASGVRLDQSAPIPAASAFGKEQRQKQYATMTIIIITGIIFYKKNAYLAAIDKTQLSREHVAADSVPRGPSARHMAGLRRSRSPTA